MARKKLTVLASGIATVAIIAGAGIAYAFSAETSTSAKGGAATMQKLAVVGQPSYVFTNQEEALWTSEVDLWGNRSHVAKVVIIVTNPNEVPVKVTSADIEYNGGSFVNADYDFCKGYLKATSAPTLDEGTVTVPAKGAATATLTVTGVYLDGSASVADHNIDECQGRQFKTDWTITGHSA